LPTTRCQFVCLYSFRLKSFPETLNSCPGILEVVHRLNHRLLPAHHSNLYHPPFSILPNHPKHLQIFIFKNKFFSFYLF
jgi:hypothetical protein